MNSEIEVDAPEVRVKKGVILARRKIYFSTAKKMMSSGVGCWCVLCVGPTADEADHFFFRIEITVQPFNCLPHPSNLLSTHDAHFRNFFRQEFLSPREIPDYQHVLCRKKLI